MLVSFAFGDEYYLDAARVLRDDCERHGTPHHIVEEKLPAGTSWIDACRHKVRFIEECRRRFEVPLWWVDVDCRLLRPLPELGGDVDLGFFLRGFREMRQFDPVALPRVIQPSILYVGTTPVARRFVHLMAERERAHAGSATDDWFMQEAWSALPESPTVAVLSPRMVQLEDQDQAKAIFRFGRSGQASVFKGQAEQHPVELFSPSRRKAVLLRESNRAHDNGERREAALLLRKAQEADPADEALAYRVADDLYRAGDRERAHRILKGLPPSETGGDHLARYRLERALQGNDLRRAKRLAETLERSAHEADRAWAQSRLMRIELALKARRYWWKASRLPRLWWMEGPYPGNFGDILNPYVVEKLTGLPPVRVEKGEGVLAIGSTIRFARDDTIVWGAGTPRMTDALNPRARYVAVRGPLTARLVDSCGGTAPRVFGDPACLLPRLYNPRTKSSRHALGVVLHHAHRGLLRFGDDVKVIDVLRAGYEGIEAFIDDVCQCERILTSSLHGLIVSHAYGIPAQWFTVVDTHSLVPGDGTKYHDYLMSVGLPAQEALPIPAGTTVDTRLRTAETLPLRALDLDALIEVAPWRVRSEVRS